jgi:flagellar protein FlgJ
MSPASATKPQNLTELEEAASQFEAIFLKMFLDQARQSKLSDDLLGSSASDNFQEMFDNELSQVGSSSFNLGLTDVIVRQLRTDLDK